MKTVDFSETIAASDLKVGRSRHLIEYMKVRYGSYLTLAQGRVHAKIQTGLSQKLLCLSDIRGLWLTTRARCLLVLLMLIHGLSFAKIPD